MSPYRASFPETLPKRPPTAGGSIDTRRPVSAVSHPERKNTRVLLFSSFLLAFTCLMTYWPVLDHQFQVSWDDQWQVVSHYTEMTPTWDNLWTIFTKFHGGQYSPINQIIYTLLHAGFGYNPFWFHTLNLAGHTLNALLVYFLLKKLLEQSKQFTVTSAYRIAFFTALLFSVHPLQTEVVAWVSASKIGIYSLFYLLALHAYLRFAIRCKIKYYLLTMLCFFLSFGAKEQAVTLPVCLLLVDYSIGRNLWTKRILVEKLPFIVLAFIFGYVTILAQASLGIGLLTNEDSYPFYQKMVFACYSLFEYVVKCLVPVKLSYLYLFPNQVDEALPLRFWIYPPIIAFLTVSLSSFWRRRWVFFGLTFFIIHIGIVLHIIPMARFVIVADRYVYLASIGVFFVLAYYLDLAINRRVNHQMLLAGLGVVYVLTLGTYTNIRSRVWHNSETLKQELKERLIEEQPGFQNHKKYTQ